MAKTKAQLSKLTADQLKDMLITELGQELVGDESKSDLVDLVLASQDSSSAADDLAGDNNADLVNPAAGNKAAAPAPAAKTNTGNKADEPRAWIKIYNDEGPTGSGKVYVSVNGDNAWIERDKWVYAKVKHIRALASAVETRYNTVRNKETGADEQRPYDVQRHKFEIRKGGPNEMPADLVDQTGGLSALDD